MTFGVFTMSSLKATTLDDLEELIHELDEAAGAISAKVYIERVVNKVFLRLNLYLGIPQIYIVLPLLLS